MDGLVVRVGRLGLDQSTWGMLEAVELSMAARAAVFHAVYYSKVFAMLVLESKTQEGTQGDGALRQNIW